MRIKNILIFLIVTNPIICLAQLDINNYLNLINIENIKSHINILASDSMEGRNTGEPGQKIAARYISNEFSNYGLKPYNAESENPYYQKFNLYKFQTGESSIYYNNLVYRGPIYLGNQSISDSISGKVVFGGFANEIDLEILDINNNSFFFFTESVKQSIEKAKAISELYPVNTFIVGLPFGKKWNDQLFEEPITDFKSFKELFYYYHYFVSDYRTKNDFNDLLVQNEIFTNFTIETEKDIKILFVPEQLASGLFWKNFKDLKKIAKSNRKRINNDLLSVNTADFSYLVNFNPGIYGLETENIVGYLDSEFSNENIVIGAHYDHVGRNPDGEINYGADDNASGTAGLLSLAKTFYQAAKEGVKFNKDIIFIAYSAEEIGLLGSEYYVQNPLFPLSQTNVLFNLDMIGRDMNDDPKNSNRVFLLDWKGGSKYNRNVKKLNKKYTNLIIDTSPGTKNRVLWSFGSDHYSFVQKDVSSIAYFTALHDDYHTPDDIPEKINYDKLNRIIKIIFLSIWDLSFQNE